MESNELLEHFDKLSKLSHIRNLITIAYSDGTIHKNERSFIFSLAEQYGISIAEMETICREPGKIAFILPETKEEKYKQLNNMVQLILADNKIDRKELSLGRYYAMKLGFDSTFFDSLLDSEIFRIQILEGIRRGQASKNNI